MPQSISFGSTQLMDHLHLSGETNNLSESIHLQFAPTMSFRDWAGLLPDILDSLVSRLYQFSDYLRFSGVCPQWRSAALRNASCHKQKLNLLKASRNKLPMLLIQTSENSDDVRGLYSILDGITYNLQLPLPYRNRFIGSSYGWLISQEEKKVITLFNPLNHNSITLPVFENNEDGNWDYESSPGYYVQKAIITEDPHLNPNNYAVVVIFGSVFRMAVYKSGDPDWTYIKHQDSEKSFTDIISYKSNIFGVTSNGGLVQLDLDGRSTKTIINDESYTADVNYLVESQGDLLLVQRFWKIEEDFGPYNDILGGGGDGSEEAENLYISGEFLDHYTSWPTSFDFKIFKLVLEENTSAKFVQVKNIGEQALFVGGNHSVSVSTKEFPGCSIAENSVYFTNHYYALIPKYESSGQNEDSGLFKLEDKSTHSHHRLDLFEWYMKPPIWFIPNFADSN